MFWRVQNVFSVIVVLPSAALYSLNDEVAMLLSELTISFERRLESYARGQFADAKHVAAEVRNFITVLGKELLHLRDDRRLVGSHR
jgi:hypothetical protein